MPTREIQIVEDSEIGYMIAQRAFQVIGAVVALKRVVDGEEALRHLRKTDGYLEAATPDVILLDLNMPKIGGRQVMAEIASDAKLQHIPVVILSTSQLPSDILELY